jgi:PGF-CTERM protein/uncharacterized repeat protein (TIGR01451 family)
METKKIKPKKVIKMSNKNNRNSLWDCLINRRVAVSVLVAIFVMVGLASPAMAQASTDAVLILHFDEGSGTIAKDASGHGNDGTIYGATWVVGKHEKALEFDGRDDYVDIGNIGLTDNWAVSFLAKSESVSEEVYYPIGTGGTDKGIGMGGTYHTISNDFYVFDGSTVLHGGPSVITGTWYYVSTVKKGSNYEIYVNGNSVINGNCGDIDITDLNIGRRSDDYWYFNGIIDEVRIYNRALTTDEIKALYEGIRTELILTKSASPSTIQEGETTTISIRVENTGTEDALSVEVTDTIPTGFKILSGLKSASFDAIKPGDYRTFEYTLKATGSGKFTCNPATATCEDADGNSYSAASNSVSIQVGGEVPVGADSDGDGWSDEKEREMGTNPYSVDSDGDGLKDPEDPNPTVPEEKKTPGFEVVFAIAGLLAVAYLLRRRG